MKRIHTLSDLTQIYDMGLYGLERDLLAGEQSKFKGGFEKAVNEIRSMKRDLKELQNQFLLKF